MTVNDPDLEFVRDVPYGPETARAHLLDILKPKNATQSLPVIVHFHGGAWKMFGKHLNDCNLFDPNWTLVQDPVREASWELLGGTAAEYPELARLASPALQVTSTAAPVLIVHGAKDAHVPLSQAQQLCDAFQRAGVQNRFELIAQGDHFINVTHVQLLQRSMLKFFRRVL